MNVARPLRYATVLATVGLSIAGSHSSSAVGGIRPGAPAVVERSYIYWDQNEEQDFFADPAGPRLELIPPWDPNGQMCVLPDGSGRFVTGYNPTTDESNPGHALPYKDPPIGLALWDRHGRFTGRTIYVPGPFALPGSKIGGDIPPDEGAGGEFNNNGTITGCVFDSHGNLFATDIGQGQGSIPPPDNGRLIEWFGPTYRTYCILAGPTAGGVGPHHVDGTGGLLDPGTLARDEVDDIYVPEPGATDPATGRLPGFGRVLKFDHRTFPATARDCPGPSNMPRRPVASRVFIQGSPAWQPFPIGIARDPSCDCWAVSSVFGAPAIAWYDDAGRPYAGKGPIVAGNFNPLGLAFTPGGDLYFVDIHLSVSTGPEGAGTIGPQDEAGGVYRVRFEAGVPLPPELIAGGLNFPVSVTTCVPSEQVCPVPASLDRSGHTPIRPDDWPTYGRTLQRTFAAPTGLDADAVRSLAPRWFFSTGHAVTANPIVVGGTVYAGSWDGNVYAIDRATGVERWRFRVQPQPAVRPRPGEPNPSEDLTTSGGLITSTAAFVPGAGDRPDLVIVGGGFTLYALRATDGSLYWTHRATGRPERPPDPAHDPTRIFSSPAAVGNTVVFGVSSDGENGYRGYVRAVNLDTGRTRWTFETDVDGRGRILNDGCGGVWSSPSIDPHRGLAFVGVADCEFGAPAPYSERVLALRVSDGRLMWTFTPPRLADVADDRPCDWDFGASANVGLDAAGRATFLGVGGKDGTYYSIDPAVGRLRWQANVVFGGFSGGFIGTTAYDGRRVYGATALGDFGRFEGFGSPGCQPGNPRDLPWQEPSMHAITADGRMAWQQALSQSFGPTTVAGGMTFVGTAITRQLQIRDAESGMLVHVIPVPAPIDSGIVVSGNEIIFGTGSSEEGTPAGVYLFAPTPLPAG